MSRWHVDMSLVTVCVAPGIEVSAQPGRHLRVDATPRNGSAAAGFG